MNDQEILSESDQRASFDGFLNYQLSDLHLDTISMASSTEAVSDRAAGVDNSESYQMEFANPSPPRFAYVSKTPLKRRSPSSTYSPPQKSANADAGFHRLISEGYQFVDLPIAASGQKDSSSVHRCFTLNCAGCKPIPPPEDSNRGILPENQTRRSLFPMSGSSTTASFPPPLPLGRTSSDPVRLSSLVNPVLPTRESNSVPRTDQNSPAAAHSVPPPRPLVRTASDPTRLTNSILPISSYEGFDYTQESPSIKRLKRVDSAKKIQQRMDEIKDWIDQVLEEDSAVINLPITPETQVPAENTMNNTDEAPLQEEVQEKEIEEEDDLEAEADVVKARRVGECTMLEFKCRCGSGYSVGIFGNSCFYKLI